MNKNLFPKLAVAIAGATLSVGVTIDAIPAKAASSYSTYNFSGIFNYGTLIGEDYYGSIQFLDNVSSFPPQLTFLRIGPQGTPTFLSPDDSLGINLAPDRWLWNRGDWRIELDNLHNGVLPKPSLTVFDSKSLATGGEVAVDVWRYNPTVSTPEPSSGLGLLGLGVLALAGLSSKKIASNRRASLPIASKSID